MGQVADDCRVAKGAHSKYAGILGRGKCQPENGCVEAQENRPIMMLFLDTEFTDFIDCELISIGMVSEDGQHEFYAEVEDYDRTKCNAHVQSGIWPLLGKSPGAIMTRAELAAQLRTWFAGLPCSLTIGCDSYMDWELLVDMLDGELPANIQGREDLRASIDTTVFNQAVCAYHSAPGQPWHHALHDARAHLAGWLAWMDAKNENGTA